MNSKSRPRFDPHTLKNLAGDRVYARGETYFHNGLVAILSIEPDRVIARVAGTENYRTVLAGRAAAVGGECSCPAFERDGFCKHMVAVALAANDAVASGRTDIGGTLAQVRRYLESRDVDSLVEMIIEQAERDPVMLRKLELAAAVMSTDDKALETRLRTAIRDATRTRGFVDYGRAAEWAAGVDAVLDTLAEVASSPRAALALDLADYSIDRIERALENIDDSDGHCGELLDRAQRIHLDACRGAKPEPVALARDLFSREAEGDYDTFFAAAAEYADVLGDIGLAEYRRLAQDAWERLPSHIGPKREPDGYRTNEFQLKSILDFFAERDGDVEMRIGLRARNLSSQWAYVELVEFCQAEGRTDEALRRAEEGLWLFEDDRPDERLVSVAADLLSKANRKDDAVTHLWRVFEKAPSATLYERLRELGGEAVVQRAVGILRQQLVGASSTPWHFPADLLVRIMIEEKMFESACAVVRDYRASRSVKGKLARACEATLSDQALAIYAEIVEELVNTGSNPAYGEAAALIERMGKLRDSEAQDAYLTNIRARHKRKRNFMKLLS